MAAKPFGLLCSDGAVLVTADQDHRPGLPKERMPTADHQRSTGAGAGAGVPAEQT